MISLDKDLSEKGIMIFLDSIFSPKNYSAKDLKDLSDNYKDVKATTSPYSFYKDLAVISIPHAEVYNLNLDSITLVDDSSLLTVSLEGVPGSSLSSFQKQNLSKGKVISPSFTYSTDLDLLWLSSYSDSDSILF